MARDPRPVDGERRKPGAGVSGMRVGELLTAAVHMDEDRQKKGDEMRFGAVLQGAGWTKRQRTRDGHRLRLWFPPSP